MLTNLPHRCVLLIALSFVPCLPAQSDWTRVTSVFPLTPGPLCQDIQPHRVLMLGARQTAAWDGTRWTISSAVPADLDRTALACDTVRGRVVAFGGIDLLQSGPSNATWEWDGVAWTRMNPAASPPARTEHALAFDPVRGTVVLFGGRDRSSNYLADTWDWDGTRWTQLSPLVSPPARSAHAMAWHTTTGRVLLFGGRSQVVNRLGDTWSFDGTNWTQLAIGYGPAPRYSPYLAGDLAGNVLLQGGNLPAPGNDTWLFDGTRWTTLAPPNAPLGLPNTTMAFCQIRLRTVLLAENPAGVTQVYEWNGANWVMASRHEVLPAESGPMAGYTGHYGGQSGLMLYAEGSIWTTANGSFWQRLSLESPGMRNGVALAHDTVRGRTVIFGGNTTAGASNDTFEFYNGGNFTNYLQRLTPAQRPPPQSGASMAFDEARRQTVLRAFDGLSGTFRTWAWDGSNWTQLQPATTPSAQGAMAYDRILQRIVLFGRSAAGLAETWEWDGSSWILRQPAVSPQSRLGAAMAFDEVRGRVVLFGGTTGAGQYSSETWEWDGSSWIRVTTTNAPGPRAFHGMAHFGGQMVLFGGRDQSFTHLPEGWQFRHLQPASWELFGAGCFGFQRTAYLGSAGHRPWLGESVLLRATGVPLNGPVALFLGNSRSSYAGLPLPLDLSGIGMTWCLLQVAPRMFAGMTTANAAATAQLQIPLDPGLVGGSLFAQAMAFDPLVNPFGAYMSNGLEGRFGLR